MKVTETVYFTKRAAWRAWLLAHYEEAAELWLIYPKKHSGLPRIPYNDAVEEALCFGWIDSINKGLDEERTVQRFSPRKPGSGYSQTNIERLRRLIGRRQVMPEVLAQVSDIVSQEYEFPPDIVAALKANGNAWRNFQRYSGSYQRIRLAYVDAARDRPQEFNKRLNHFLRKTEQDKQFGFGIESYY